MDVLKQNEYNLEELLNPEEIFITFHKYFFKDTNLLNKLLCRYPKWPWRKDRLEKGVYLPVW